MQDTPAREVEMSHSSCILPFDLIGEHPNKRLYVTEIVLSLTLPDVFFRRERSDDRKYDQSLAWCPNGLDLNDLLGEFESIDFRILSSLGYI